MKKKHEKKGENVPLWLLTFADMSQLIMVFFIFLYGLSAAQQQEPRQLQLRSKLKEIRKSLVGTPVRELPAANPLGVYLEGPPDQRPTAGAVLKSIRGNQILVKSIDEGTQITIGGTSIFEPGSYVIRPDQVEVVREIVRLVKGYRNKIHVKGHTSTEPNDAVVVLPTESGGVTIRPYEPDNPAHAGKADRWLLSYLRAREIVRYLIQGEDLSGSEMNPVVDPRRIRLSAMSQYQGLFEVDPLDRKRVGENRRVEFVLSDDLVD